MEKIEDIVSLANKKLRKITENGGASSYEDVCITADTDENGFVSVYSGTTCICTGSFAEAKRAIWKQVDDTRAEVKALTGMTEEAAAPFVAKPERPERREAPRRFSDLEHLLWKLNDVVGQANKKLAEIVKGEYPFKFDEVVLSVTKDSAGVYIRSGNTPVASESIDNEDKERVFLNLRDEIWDTVDGVRASVERRVALRDDAEKLVAESAERDKAAAALKSAGVGLEIIGMPDDEAAKSITEAARKAVRRANRGLRLYFTDVCEKVYGSLSTMRMVVKSLSGGIVVEAGGQACLVTHFPKIVNNNTLKGIIDHITVDIAAVGESRQRYFRSVQRLFEREEAIRKEWLARCSEELRVGVM